MEVQHEEGKDKLKLDEVAHYKAWLEIAEYYGHALNKSQAFGYVRDTLHIPVDMLKAILKKVRMSNKFFPRPAEILEEYAGKSKDSGVSDEDERDLVREAFRVSLETKLTFRRVLRMLKSARTGREAYKQARRESRQYGDLTKNNFLITA